MAKMIGLGAIDLTMSGGDRAFDREPEEDVGAFDRLGERARRVLMA